MKLSRSGWTLLKTLLLHRLLTKPGVFRDWDRLSFLFCFFLFLNVQLCIFMLMHPHTYSVYRLCRSLHVCTSLILVVMVGGGEGPPPTFIKPHEIVGNN